MLKLSAQSNSIGRLLFGAGCVVLAIGTIGFIVNLPTVFEILSYTSMASESATLLGVSLGTILNGTLMWYISALLLWAVGEIVRLLSVAAGEEKATKE